jgi:hypothetical protein
MKTHSSTERYELGSPALTALPFILTKFSDYPKLCPTGTARLPFVLQTFRMSPGSALLFENI